MLILVKLWKEFLEVIGKSDFYSSPLIIYVFFSNTCQEWHKYSCSARQPYLSKFLGSHLWTLSYNAPVRKQQMLYYFPYFLQLFLLHECSQVSKKNF